MTKFACACLLLALLCGCRRECGDPHPEWLTVAPSRDAGTIDASHPLPSSPENCGNGQDDNGDGKIDCADPSCSQYQCFADAPSGWSLIVLHTGTPLPDACGADYPDQIFQGGTGVSATPAECSSCTCSPVGSCASAREFSLGFLNIQGSQCPTTSDPTCALSIDAQCLSFDVIDSMCPGMGPGLYLKALPKETLSCSPSPQTWTASSASWLNAALACGPPGGRPPSTGGCADGQICAPEIGGDVKRCISRPGATQDCPLGPYTDHFEYFSTMEDGRSCSDCTCAGDCSYVLHHFDSTGCKGSETELNADDCLSVQRSDAVNVSVSPACAADGGRPLGDAHGKPGTELTVCCAP